MISFVFSLKMYSRVLFGVLFIIFIFDMSIGLPSCICVPKTSCKIYVNSMKNCGIYMGIPHVCCGPVPNSFVLFIPDQRPNQERGQPSKQKSSMTATSEEALTAHKNFGLLPSHTCGPIQSDVRITNGDSATLGEFPWMALLVYDIGESIGFRCGGTVINKNYVLTAAHCVVNTNIIGIRLGEYNVVEDPDCVRNICAPPTIDLLAEDVIAHPGYNPLSLEHDIALIRIANNLNFRTANVQPICLPFQSHNLDGKNVTVSGWGVTEKGFRSSQLKKTRIPVVPLEECRKTYNSYASIRSNQICAGGIEGKDTCDGDSGGPLQDVATINGVVRYVQYGIVSYGPRHCGAENQPAVYTRVSSYLEWILDNIKPSTS